MTEISQWLELKPPRSIAYDDWWPDPHIMGGSAHYVSGDKVARVPVLLVPDRERGGYKEHEVRKAPKGKMGFR